MCYKHRERHRYQTEPAYRERKNGWHARRIRASTEYRDKRRTNTKRFHNRTKYGLTLEEKAKRIADQGGLCGNPGCRTDKPGRGWHSDHNHITNKLRGELCMNCNLALGHLHESPEKIMGLIDYLKLHGEI